MTIMNNNNGNDQMVVTVNEILNVSQRGFHLMIRQTTQHWNDTRFPSNDLKMAIHRIPSWAYRFRTGMLQLVKS